MDEWQKALERLRQARANFEQATGDYVDVAIAELQAAEATVRAILKEAKGNVA